MKSLAFIAATLLATADALTPSKILRGRATAAKQPLQHPSQPPQLKTITVQGCFSSSGDMVRNSTLEFNSSGKCAKDICNEQMGLPVAATMGGNECWCGKTYPPVNTRTNDTACDIGCTGYDLEACGGVMMWTVYNTGLSVAVKSSGGDSAKQDDGESSSKTSAPTEVVTKPAETVIISNPAEQDKKSGTNTAGIAAGVVVAVVVLAAAAGGVFFFFRRRKNREIEEEHRRNAAVNSFMGKPPSSSGMSITDARLDPVMAQRRMSDGSIADNQDYSRKILRVTNA
ncbi:hypothetical protein B0H66DRAFT_607830 [Apodospora peruviana]|uniref:WSC domain-containing protein n=1 Tax=Apodospora peruviana TaxID=516989 RepID=A0AAE0HTS3_9PEZI|nr:hypothetical protein B0H66DRAFT_607830 [Apodospora peruviana]